MRDLAKFNSGSKKNAKFRIQIAVWVTIGSLCLKYSFIPSLFKKIVLTIFGAQIGNNVVLRRGLKIQFPWNLEIGNNCWIGEDVWFINHEKVKIGSNVCISQRSIICSGGHDYRSASLEYSHKPIEIKDGAWVCLDAKVLPGVTIGQCSVVSAGEIVRNSVPDYSMFIEGVIRPIDPPK
jgi:putative colanic acid biosynthesis acetyltransferase WcaF